MGPFSREDNFFKYFIQRKYCLARKSYKYRDESKHGDHYIVSPLFNRGGDCNNLYVVDVCMYYNIIMHTYERGKRTSKRRDTSFLLNFSINNGRILV